MILTWRSRHWKKKEMLSFYPNLSNFLGRWIMAWSWLYLILISAVEIEIHYSDLVFVCLFWCMLGLRAESGMLPEAVDTKCLLPSFSMTCSETEFYWTWLADCLGWVANKPPGSFCLHLLALRLELSCHTGFLHRYQVSKLRALCLHSKHFLPMCHLLTLVQCFYVQNVFCHILSQFQTLEAF